MRYRSGDRATARRTGAQSGRRDRNNTSRECDMDSDLELGIAAAALALPDPVAGDSARQSPQAAPAPADPRPVARLMWFGAATLGQCDLLLRGRTRQNARAGRRLARRPARRSTCAAGPSCSG